MWVKGPECTLWRVVCLFANLCLTTQISTQALGSGRPRYKSQFFHLLAAYRGKWLNFSEPQLPCGSKAEFSRLFWRLFYPQIPEWLTTTSPSVATQVSFSVKSSPTSIFNTPNFFSSSHALFFSSILITIWYTILPFFIFSSFYHQH